MSNQRNMYHEKYYKSDIFNLEPEKECSYNVPTTQKKTNPRTEKDFYSNTKTDVFKSTNFNQKKTNIEEPSSNKGDYCETRSQFQRESDIFNQKKAEPIIRDSTNRRNKTNESSVFNGIRNDEKYKQEMEYYTKNKRPKMEEYDPDKYLKPITAAERYYNEIYSKDKDLIAPSDKANSNLKNNLDQDEIAKQYYIDRKKHQQEEKIENNKQGEQFNQTRNNKTKSNWMSSNSCAVNFVYSKDGGAKNAKLNRVRSMQSNIFNEEKEEPDYGKDNLVNKKIEENPSKNEKDEKDVGYFSQTCKDFNRPKYPEKKETDGKERNLWGGSHKTKWVSNLDWKNPNTEIMFKNNKDEMNQNARDRKLRQLADSDNADTIANYKKNAPNSNIKNNNQAYEGNTLGIGEKKQVMNYNKGEVYKYKISFLNEKSNNPNLDYELKKLMGQKGIHAFDLKDPEIKNGVTTYKFKVRDNDGKIESKMKVLEDSFCNRNKNVVLEKENIEENFTKNKCQKMRTPFGLKTTMLTDNCDDNEHANQLEVNNDKGVGHNFTRGYEQVNYKYKKFAYN